MVDWATRTRGDLDAGNTLTTNPDSIFCRASASGGLSGVGALPQWPSMSDGRPLASFGFGGAFPCAVAADTYCWCPDSLVRLAAADTFVSNRDFFALIALPSVLSCIACCFILRSRSEGEYIPGDGEDVDKHGEDSDTSDDDESQRLRFTAASDALGALERQELLEEQTLVNVYDTESRHYRNKL